jgi:putative DNA primase/helicase
MEPATFDMHTGTSRAPDPLDYITKKTACACAPPGTPHPLWDAFMGRITASDGELQAFLRRFVGYCCTGCTHEHVFVFAYGTGANGKSTFINTVRNILGDYATVAAMSTFLDSNTEHHPTDLAKLRGVRLAVAQETEQGRHWDEAKIKTLTGGDTITAHFMRQDFFDFVPQFKLFICGNHKPQLRNVDEAMRRRLLLVPFTVQIPPAEQDKDLPDKLRAEWPAILRWMVDGCGEWRRMGLAPPKAVRDATAEYFSEQDTVKDWMSDCTTDGGASVVTRSRDLFQSWKTWCDDRNFRPGTAKAFSQALQGKGCEPGRDGTGQRGYRRLTLKRV